MMSSPVNVI